jgi:hypothetical protein
MRMKSLTKPSTLSLPGENEVILFISQELNILNRGMRELKNASRGF